MTDNKNFNNFDTESELDLSRVLRFILLQSKLIISIVIISTIISIALFISSTKQYEIKSLLEVEASSQGSIDPTDTVSYLSKPQSDINNLIKLYESRSNILKLINTLNLNIDIDGLKKNQTLLYSINKRSELSVKSTEFKLRLFDDFYEIADKKSDYVDQFSYGELNNFNGLNIQINRPDFPQDFNELNITYKDPSTLFNKYKNKINVISSSGRSSFYNQQGLIEVTMVTDNIEKGLKIINNANNNFLDYRINVETEKARRAIRFIDSNIAAIKGIVEKNKNSLKEFREENNTLNVDLEIQGYVDKIQDIDAALFDLEIDLSSAGETYTQQNPIYINLLTKKNVLVNQKDEIISQIQQLPKEQQEYIDLYKSVEISQNLFEELESRRLGFSIIEASTIGNIRVIDPAYMSRMVSPRIANIVLVFIFSFIVAIIIAVIRGFNFLPITNPAELADHGINQPIVGVLPLLGEDAIELDSPDDQFDNALESLIVNIKSIQSENTDSKIITITSPSPNNGKSTISSKLANKLSGIGKRVLLLDADLKRGGLHKLFDRKLIKPKDFENISHETFKNYAFNENLYIIPRIRSLNSSFEFFSSGTFINKINFIKDHFDFVIIDTAPVLSVADTSLILKNSDINFLITRHESSRINEIKQSINQFTQIGLNLNGIVYNAYAKPKGYYGYYNLYGNYAYKYYAERYLEYSYEYKKD